VRGWRQLHGSGGGGSAESVGDGASRAQTTGGGGGVESARGPGAREPEARAGCGWLKRKECRDDDVGEQATRILHSLSLSRGKTEKSACKSGEVIPLIARGLLRNIALCSSGFALSFF
jgi:hypothetical protein